LVDIGPDMLNADGTFLPGMMLDYVHPTEKGYEIWGNHIQQLINQP
jgi:lysophospholipase L1-like esterase